MWLTNTLQSTLIVYFYPERWVDPGHTETAAEVKRHAQARVGELLDQADAELARHSGPWLLGDSYSALDPYLFTLCRWTRGFSSAPARGRPQPRRHIQRRLERAAVQRALATEGLQAPFV